MLSEEGVIENAIAVTYTAGEFVNPVETSSFIYCTADGTVDIELFGNGFATTKAMVAGSYWRVRADKVLETSTATVEVHW